MTTTILSNGARIILLPYDLDVSAFHTYGKSKVLDITIRLENVSLLVISRADPLKTLGIPEDDIGIINVSNYLSEDQTIESTLGNLAVSKINAIKNRLPRKMAHLTSVTYHGPREDFLRWAGSLISMGLSETKEVGFAVASLVGGEPIFEERLYVPFKDPELNHFDSMLTIPIHLYLMNWISDSPRDERSQKDESRQKDESTHSRRSEKTNLDSVFSDMFGNKEKGYDVYEIIAKINELGVKPSSLILNPGQRYATIQQFDEFSDRNKEYNISKISSDERNCVLNHFSYIIGMKYREAINKVTQEGMKLAVGRIEGRPPTKFLTTDMRRISVLVRDPHPVNSENPSEMGIIVEILGFVIVTRNGFVE